MSTPTAVPAVPAATITPSTTPLQPGTVREPSTPYELEAARQAVLERINESWEAAKAAAPATPQSSAATASAPAGATAPAATPPGEAAPTPTPAPAAAPAAPAAAPKPADAKADEKPPEPKPEDKKDELFGPRFKALAKKEWDVKQREAAVSEKEKTIGSVDALKTLARDNPRELFKQLGVDLPTALKKIAVTKDGEVPKPTVEEQLRELREKTERTERERKEAEQKSRAQAETNAIAALKTGIARVVDGKKDADFRMTALEGEDGVEAVFELMDLTLKTKGVILPLDEACSRIEAVLVERARKIQSALQPQGGSTPATPPATQPAPKAPANGQQQRPAPTLNSSHVPNAAAAAPSAPKANETDEEKIQRLSKGLFKRA